MEKCAEMCRRTYINWNFLWFLLVTSDKCWTSALKQGTTLSFQILFHSIFSTSNSAQYKTYILENAIKWIKKPMCEFLNTILTIKRSDITVSIQDCYRKNAI
jgi:hypothetical protein